MSKIVFVVRHEYQYWVACSIVKKFQISTPVFLLMGNWEPIKIVYKHLRVPDLDMSSSFLKKIQHLLFSPIPKLDIDEIYIPTNLDPYINKLLRKLRPGKVSIFDEGGGAVYSYMPSKKWYAPLVLLGWTERRWGEGKRISRIFTPNPEIYSSSITTELIDIASDMRSVAKELYESLLSQVESNSIGGVVVLTQPYPADYLGPKEDGNSILLKFTAERWHTGFVKGHPRECSMLAYQGEFKILPLALQRIPLQAIAIKFPIDSIVSNCSSALLNTAKISERPIVAYSLISRVSNTKLTDPFRSAAVKIKGLVLV